MSIIKRLFEYFKEKGIAHTAFEKAHGLSNGYLARQRRNNGQLGETALLAVVENCADLRLHWLITGKGEMLKAAPELKKGHVEEKELEKDILERLISVEQRVRMIEKLIATEGSN